jgi:hypothetical protein
VLLTCNHVLTITGSPTLIPSDSQVAQPAGGPLVGNTKRIVPMLLAPLRSIRLQVRGAGGHSDCGPADNGAPRLQRPRASWIRTQLRPGTVEAVELSKRALDSIFRHSFRGSPGHEKDGCKAGDRDYIVRKHNQKTHGRTALIASRYNAAGMVKEALALADSS